jgi:Transposase IS116/IS110/IS902 family
VGVGPVIAGRLLGRTGRASRFPTAAHFASYIGAAPLKVASGEHARHRLSRAGDRQRNHALHIVALVQARSPGCTGYHYFRRKLAEGKTTREAMRCLSAGSPTTSGGSCSPTNKPATNSTSKRFDTQRRPPGHGKKWASART